MKWLINDLKAAFAELKQGSTWLVIGLIAGFGLLSFIVAQFALQTDTMLRYLRISSFNCREMTNSSIIFMFFGMIFFGLTIISTFGEIQRYFLFKNRKSHYEARQAKIYGLIWGGIAMTLSVSAIVFFKLNCW